MGIELLNGVEAVPWAELHGAHGPREDVPDLLTMLVEAEQAEFAQAHSGLYNHVIHPGSRWQVSAHLVPFLAQIAAIRSDNYREAVVALLIEIGLGYAWGDDATLPFVATGLPSEEHAAYLRFSECGDQILRWAEDESPGVAITAMSATPWLPKIAESAQRVLLRGARNPVPEVAGCALLTLGLLSGIPSAPTLDACAEAFHVDGGDRLVRTCASVAAAQQVGAALPDDMLDWLLAVTENWGDLGDRAGFLPYERPLRGFVAKAIHRVEEAPCSGRT